jgi:TRAP-type C4-dicarboxylate transport system substrate-binding protein
MIADEARARLDPNGGIKVRTRNSSWRLFVLTAVLALFSASCDGGAADTTAAETTTTEAGATTTQAEDGATTTAAAMDFGDPVTLTLGHPFPEQHPIHQNVWLPYAEEVNTATEGAVTIEIHAGGALAALPNTFDNTVVGGQDMGWALHGYHPGVFPVTEIIELPFQFSSAVQATQTMWDIHDEFEAFQGDYESVKLLGLWTHEVGDLFFNEESVTTLEQLNGLNLRTPNATMTSFFEQVGASPINMGAPEIFDALSTGVIDGLATATSALQSFNLYDEVAYITRCDCYLATQYLVINLDTWNSLTSDTQAVMESLAREYSVTAGEVYDGLYTAVTEIALEQGVEELELSEDELARWHEVGEQVASDWIAEREAQGVPAQEMFDRMQDIKAQYEG